MRSYQISILAKLLLKHNVRKIRIKKAINQILLGLAFKFVPLISLGLSNEYLNIYKNIKIFLKMMQLFLIMPTMLKYLKLINFLLYYQYLRTLCFFPLLLKNYIN